MSQSKVGKIPRRPPASAKTIDNILKRSLFIYCPILLFFLFIVNDSSTSIPASSTKLVKESNASNELLVDRSITSKHSDGGYLKKENRHTAQSRSDNESGDKLQYLDFLLAGFAKAGTTSLLHLFDKHDETTVAPTEICHFQTEAEISKLMSQVNHLPVKSVSSKRGIKCPTTIWNTRGLERLVSMNPNLKIVVGVRHPIHWFQSYYNYRITEMYDRNDVTIPPPPTSLTGSKHWKGVYTDGARFELGLMQLGLIDLESKDLQKLAKSGRRVLGFRPSQVFLYAIDQLEDTNEARSRQFRRELQKFLGLETPLEQIPKSNINHFVGESKHPETIDICDHKYKSLRSILTKNGLESLHWIKSKFAHHKDVTVGGVEHFIQIIDEWKNDPCS